jgi:aryl-alcohol dehydrogenase-like predicted oxidoreductase
VDEYAVGSLEFDRGIVASVTTGVGVDQENVVRIYGTEGHIFVPQPWAPSTEGQPSRIYVQRAGESAPREILIDPGNWLYALEADVVAANITRREPSPPAMTHEDTLGNMRTLERWRQAVGLTYEAERTAASVRTAHRRPLSVRAGAKMDYGPIAGVPIHVSRVGLGVDDATFPPTVDALWDDYFERGGNCFDTAYIYRGGACERALGDWVRARGVRDRVVIVDKGGHTPECEPCAVARQLRTSLDRLGIDQIDLHLLHRDNPDVPVGEFADVLDDAVKSGAVRAIGASNWTLPRVKEFNDWAARHGKPRFAVVSNQFSLARMVEPPWPGCLSANDAEWTAWLSQTRTPLLAWSSQARGFFLDSSGPDDRTEPDRVRCWHSPDNFRRLERARELAKRKAVLPINIALAYVLRQPFPTFALIGARTIHETRTSLEALRINLTPDEMRWLDLAE